MSRLGIVGAGGHGREAHAVASETGQPFGAIVFADDGTVDTARLGRLGVRSIIGVEALADHADVHVIAIGDSIVRRRLAGRLTVAATTLVSAAATLGTDVELAPGAMVYPGAIITTNVRIGAHSHVNCGAIVSHDCRIGDYASLSPGVKLNGNVVIEDDVFLGTGAIVLPGRRVGQGAVVGAGAVVTTDVAAGATVVGVPAR